MSMVSRGAAGPGQLPRVCIGDAAIPYLLGGVEEFGPAARDLAADRWLLVADGQPTLAGFTDDLTEVLSRLAPVHRIPVPVGEAAKSLETVASVCAQAVAAGASRASVVVAVGGGNACNIAGLCAALLFRGVRLVQVPTTLIAMSDVVLSLKQGVNLAGVKNGLGTYYAPEHIWADPRVLESLPAREIRAGQAEMIKNALILVPEQIPILLDLFRPDGRYSVEELVTLIRLAITAKSRVLRQDARERHGALVLEYGHTVGHALEVLAGGGLGHGYAVALGMRVAARVAHRLGRLDRGPVELHDQLLRAAGLPLTPPAEVVRTATADALAAQLARDNKRGYLRPDPDQLPMVLLAAPGVPARTGDLPLTAVRVDDVVSSFQEAFARPAGEHPAPIPEARR